MVEKQPVVRSFSPVFFALLIIGLAIGWLVGMSVSPVVSALIASVTTLAAALVASMGSLQREPGAEITGRWSGALSGYTVNPWPLAMLMAGIFIGAVLGVFVRTNNLLSPRQTSKTAELLAEVQMWENLGLDRAVVAERLFDLQYPAGGEPSERAMAAEETSAAEQKDSVLFDFPISKCSELINADDANLLRALKNEAVYGVWSKLPEIVPEPGQIRRMLQEVLCAAE